MQNISHAQVERMECNSDLEWSKMSSIEKENLEKYTNQFIQKNKRKAPDCERQYVIPVVFHVFGTQFGGLSVDDSVVIAAVETVNRDYIGMNSDYNEVDSLFMDRRATLNLKLALAQKDPEGNPTTGIVYYDHVRAFDTNYDHDRVAQYGWDNYKYCNVYIHNMGGTGIAWFPSVEMNDQGSARIVYNGFHLGTNAYDVEIQSVLTHEFGHFFNLYHTFQGGCSEYNDGVDDTPPCNSQQGCENAFNCYGDKVNSENYMDYNYTCYKMFTQGQRERMIAGLNHPSRISLWQKGNLEATGVLDQLDEVEAAPIASIDASLLNIDREESIVFKDNSCNIATTYSWTFEGGNIETSTKEQVEVRFDLPGEYDVSLTSSNRFGTSETVQVTVIVKETLNCIWEEKFEETQLLSYPSNWTKSWEGSFEAEVIKEVDVNSKNESFKAFSPDSSQMLYLKENWISGGPGEQWLISPEIDLTNEKEARLSYSELVGWDYGLAVNDPDKHVLELNVSNSSIGPWIKLTDIEVGKDPLNWQDVSGIDLSDYDGQKIHLAWKTTTHHYYLMLDDICVSTKRKSLHVIPDERFKVAFTIQNNWLLAPEAIRITVLDLSGRVIQKSASSGMNISDVSTGIYLLHFETKAGIATEKIFLK